jgi:photosystem II stability/assembly factor-like uncharacterized protein
MTLSALAATDDGLHIVGPDTKVELGGRAVTDVVRDGAATWALADGRDILRFDGGDWKVEASAEAWPATSLLPTPEGVFVGTAEAHLLQLVDGSLETVESFENVADRGEWFTPWGGPPDVRSMTRDDAALYVNIHVGGIPRSTDGGASWTPTIEVGSDVHEVITDPGKPGRLFAATAFGLAVSEDGGDSWTFEDEGLHATYCRAVAVAGDRVFVTASTGPSGNLAALYRRVNGSFLRCETGLPEWFTGNIDTGCVAAAGDTVVFGTADGDLFASTDGGETWEEFATGLPAVRRVLL